MWISLSDSSYVTTPVEKWLISSADMQKWFKWSWGHFALHCLCLSGYICMCVCYSMCCLSQWRLLLLPLCRLMAPMSLLHESLNTFIIPLLPVSWWTLFHPWSWTRKQIAGVYQYLFDTVCTHIYIHAQIGFTEPSHQQLQDFVFFFLLLLFLIKLTRGH